MIATLGLLGILGAIYWFLVRPGQLHWGATPSELAAPLPEDDVVRNPAFDATRAITIAAPPEKIWPWLVQMGYGRAGFYGYDLIENPGSGSGLRSADRILPQFQDPRPGDPLPLSVAASLQFGTVEAPRVLVWRGREAPPAGVFIWALAPVDATHTRLISRIRWRYLDSVEGRVLGLFTEFADHVAVRAILRGVRDRVEGRRTPSLTLQAAEIAAWMLALGEFAGAALLVLFRVRWRAPWLAALGAGLLLQWELYGPAPPWLNALLPWAFLALLLAWRRRRLKAATNPLVEAQSAVRVP